MRALSASQLLDVWERGRSQSSAKRAVLLLAAALPEQSLDQVAAFSIGRRDAQLLTLREVTFGQRAVGLADCPQCKVQVEIDLSLSDLRVTVPDDSATWSMTIGEVDVNYRLPNSLDLMVVAQLVDIDAIHCALLERCLTLVKVTGEPRPIGDLSPKMLDAIDSDMAQHDPQAQVELALKCPQCAHAWAAIFDIAAFLWAEINAWAQRLLVDVHTLASTYHWREADILALSAYRRQAYLDLINV